jgi:hypothetical protein
MASYNLEEGTQLWYMQVPQDKGYADLAALHGAAQSALWAAFALFFPVRAG